MAKFVVNVCHRGTGKEEYLVREAVSERALRDALSDEGLVVCSMCPADFGGKGARFEIRTPKGRVSGPFGPDILRAMVRDGSLTPLCSIRKTGDLESHAWNPAWKVKGLFPMHVVDDIRRSHAAAPGDDDETARLKSLKKLLDDGLIDEQDYRHRKAELLGTPYDVAVEEPPQVPQRVEIIESPAFQRDGVTLTALARRDEASAPQHARPAAWTFVPVGVHLLIAIALAGGIGFAGSQNGASMNAAMGPAVTPRAQNKIGRDAERLVELRQQFLERFQTMEKMVGTEMRRVIDLNARIDGQRIDADLFALRELADTWRAVETHATEAQRDLAAQFRALSTEAGALARGGDTKANLQGEQSILDQLDAIVRSAESEIASTEALIETGERIIRTEAERRSPEWAEQHFEEFADRFIDVAAEGGNPRIRVDRQFQFKTEHIGAELRGLIIITSWYPYDKATKSEDRLWLVFRGGKWQIHSLESFLLAHGIWQRSSVEADSRRLYEIILEKVNLMGGNP